MLEERAHHRHGILGSWARTRELRSSIEDCVLSGQQEGALHHPSCQTLSFSTNPWHHWVQEQLASLSPFWPMTPQKFSSPDIPLHPQSGRLQVDPWQRAPQTSALFLHNVLDAGWSYLDSRTSHLIFWLCQVTHIPLYLGIWVATSASRENASRVFWDVQIARKNSKATCGRTLIKNKLTANRAGGLDLPCSHCTGKEIARNHRLL
jgi:hypothetical protein